MKKNFPKKAPSRRTEHRMQVDSDQSDSYQSDQSDSEGSSVNDFDDQMQLEDIDGQVKPAADFYPGDSTLVIIQDLRRKVKRLQDEVSDVDYKTKAEFENHAEALNRMYHIYRQLTDPHIKARFHEALDQLNRRVALTSASRNLQQSPPVASSSSSSSTQLATPSYATSSSTQSGRSHQYTTPSSSPDPLSRGLSSPSRQVSSPVSIADSTEAGESSSEDEKRSPYHPSRHGFPSAASSSSSSAPPSFRSPKS